MKIENVSVFGFSHAIRAMRNPKDSWEKSDSFEFPDKWGRNKHDLVLGANDIKLSRSLTKAGTEHCKHLRMVQVWFDLTLPRYVWQEFDTYRFVEKVSCSTMHTLMKKPITEDMFEGGMPDPSDKMILSELNDLIKEYLAEDAMIKKYPRDSEDLAANVLRSVQRCRELKAEVKRKLPESFLQKRTVNTNYQCLLNMYHQRKNHELEQWRNICAFITTLPCFSGLTGVAMTKCDVAVSYSEMEI